jgi:hypothetical protein
MHTTRFAVWSQRILPVSTPGMRARRLEDRVRELCGQAAVAQEPELNPILMELRSALREHTERMRRKALERLVSGAAKRPNSNISLSPLPELAICGL